MVQLKGFRVNSVSFENKVQNGTQLKLKNHFNYNVSYMDGENKCIGTLNFKIADENMLPFEIKLDYKSTQRIPRYILIVASSSKYGDYFTGGAGSTLWLDDLELLYDY